MTMLHTYKYVDLSDRDPHAKPKEISLQVKSSTLKASNLVALVERAAEDVLHANPSMLSQNYWPRDIALYAPNGGQIGTYKVYLEVTPRFSVYPTDSQGEITSRIGPNSCNLHRDCAAADKRAQEGGGRFAPHCTDEYCEDCLGA